MANLKDWGVGCIYVVSALSVFFLIPSGAMAQTPAPGQQASVVALDPIPHPAGCADFQSAGNGQWRPLVRININNMITMGPGVSFGEGASFGGINIAGWLNNNCLKN